MIKNIIFDIGNVCVTFDPVSYFIQYFGSEDNSKEICHCVFQNPIWLACDQGLVSFDELCQKLRQEFPEKKEEINIVLENWWKLMVPIDSTYTLMRKLRSQGFHLYILSNISEASADYLHRYPFMSYVDDAIFSYKEKQVKPDPEIYEIMLSRFDLLPEECVFIDDIDQNIKAARQKKMHGIVYHDAKQLETELFALIRRNAAC